MLKKLLLTSPVRNRPNWDEGWKKPNDTDVRVQCTFFFGRKVMISDA